MAFQIEVNWPDAGASAANPTLVNTTFTVSGTVWDDAQGRIYPTSSTTAKVKCQHGSVSKEEDVSLTTPWGIDLTVPVNAMETLICTLTVVANGVTSQAEEQKPFIKAVRGAPRTPPVIIVFGEE